MRNYGTTLNLEFTSDYIIDETISIKYFLLTNLDPQLTLTVICKAETTHSFSNRIQ